MSPGFNRSQDYWNSLGLDGRGPGEGSMKRKYSEEEEKKEEDFAKRRQQNQYMPYGNPNGFPAGPGYRGGEFSAEDSLRANKYMRGFDDNVGGGFRLGGSGGGGGDGLSHKYLGVDQSELKKAFLRFAKLVNESVNQRKNYLENGKHSHLQCVACSRFDEIEILGPSLSCYPLTFLFLLMVLGTLRYLNLWALLLLECLVRKLGGFFFCWVLCCFEI